MKRGRNKAVTPRDVQAFHRAYLELKSFRLAGKACGVSQATVHKALADHGLIQPARRHRRTLPDEVVAEIVVDYQRLRSIARVADRCGRTRQAVWEILHRRGLTLPPKPGLEKVMHHGEAFTVGKNGYLRSTRFATRFAGKTRLLHRVIWEEQRGPIPVDQVIYFKDQDRLNCDIDNLECITRSELRKRIRNANAWTVFYETHDYLLHEWQQAIADERPPEEIEQKRRLYENLPRPIEWSEERHRQHREMMLKMWAERSPAQRQALANRQSETRRRKRGSVIEALLKTIAA